MVEVKVRDLITHRDEYIIVDETHDDSMSDQEFVGKVKPLVMQYLKHADFRILTWTEI